MIGDDNAIILRHRELYIDERDLVRLGNEAAAKCYINERLTEAGFDEDRPITISRDEPRRAFAFLQPREPRPCTTAITRSS